MFTINFVARPDMAMADMKNYLVTQLQLEHIAFMTGERVLGNEDGEFDYAIDGFPMGTDMDIQSCGIGIQAQVPLILDAMVNIERT